MKQGIIYFFLRNLKSAAENSDWFQADFPVNTMIREMWIQQCQLMLLDIEKWINELQLTSNNSIELENGRKLEWLTRQEWLEMLHNWMNVDDINIEIQPKRNEARLHLQHAESISALIWYLKMIYNEIKQYDIEIHMAIELLKRAYWDSLIEALNSKKK